MSELNQDKKILEDGRKAPLKDVEAPLRDQVVEKLYATLDEMGIAEKVATLWSKGNANRTTWLERQRAYLATWDEHLISDTSGAFAGSSQIHVPMPLVVCKTLHARYLQALWGVDPPFRVKARTEASMSRVGMVHDTLRYTLYDYANYYKGVEEVVDKWVWDWLTMGSGLLKWRWDIKYSRFVDVQLVTVAGTPKVVTDETGKTIAVPTQKQVEKEVKVTKKTFDGPVLSLVDPEKLLIVGGAGDPHLADAVIEEVELTASELWTLVDQKIYNSDAVEAVIEAGPDSYEGSQSNALNVQRSQNAGKARMDGDRDLDRYRILEAYLKVDTDSSGINTDVIVWIHPNSKQLLRATYLYRVSKTGERPYGKADFHLRKGQDYGIGMVEMLYPLSKEMDAIHNMRIDFGLVSVMPFGFYRASSGIDPETIQLEPGALIPVDNPQTDVFFPNLGNRTVFGMQEEQAIQQMIERLTSISDLNLGLMSGGQGATRTATGSRALVGEMSSNLDVYLRRLNRGWKTSLKYLTHMLQQRIPPGLSFRVTGEDGNDYWREVKNEQYLEGDFDIELSATSSSSNMGIQQDNAQQVLQLVQNPLAIQLGCVNPGGFYEALKNMFQSLGVRDYGRFISKPQGYEHVPTPEEEANRILHGMPVPVTPNMDHEGFINYFQHIHEHDELLGQFSPQNVIQLKVQALKHEQMLQALQAMQAQQANSAQMQRNAVQSGQQAPVGQNPMQQAPAPTAPAPGAVGG